MKNRVYAVILAGVILISFLATACLVSAASDKTKNDLERVDFIHYKKDKNDVKPAGGNPAKIDPCYKLMGVKWGSLPVSYIINPTNSQGLSASFITSAISTGAETWDTSTSKELFSNLYSIDYSAKYGVQDYKNSIVFGSYSQNNVIAVTSVWYSRTTKQIVEFDQLYNTYYLWGNFSFYFPLTTSILISIILSLILWLLNRR